MKKLFASVSVLFIVISLTFSLVSCGSTNTSKGATTGAIVGGLVDGWGGAATGALIGGGVGLMADSAEDKKIRQQQKERELAMLEKSSVTEDPKTAYKPSNSNPLTGSTWRVISLVDEKDNKDGFASIVITFQTNTKATTLILWKDGRSETYGETYTVLNDALIFSGKDYVTNTKYSINGNQMILVAPDLRVVLEEVEEGV